MVRLYVHAGPLASLSALAAGACRLCKRSSEPPGPERRPPNTNGWRRMSGR